VAGLSTYVSAAADEIALHRSSGAAAAADCRCHFRARAVFMDAASMTSGTSGRRTVQLSAMCQVPPPNPFSHNLHTAALVDTTTTTGMVWPCCHEPFTNTCVFSCKSHTLLYSRFFAAQIDTTATTGMTQLPPYWFFVRDVARPERDQLQRYRLPARRYLGPTSMDSELAFIMCNHALVRPARLPQQRMQLVEDSTGTYARLLLNCAQVLSTHCQSIHASCLACL